MGIRGSSVIEEVVAPGSSEWLQPGALEGLVQGWNSNAEPFRHAVVDGFFREEVARALSEEFPEADDARWRRYENPIERKSLINHWDAFPPLTYRALEFFNSGPFTEFARDNFWPGSNLVSDSGLNGGGWHAHNTGEKLNVHLDYSLHPKLGLQRVLNLIVYLTPDWNPSWGGGLGLWTGDLQAPKELVTTVDCVFNRAVIFDTTGASWHGLPDPIDCPADVRRKSLAVYHLSDPPEGVDRREKALFAPTQEQADDQEVLDLIRKRSNAETAHQVYE